MVLLENPSKIDFIHSLFLTFQIVVKVSNFMNIRLISVVLFTFHKLCTSFGQFC